MPMVRAMRLLNAIEAGTTTGAQLETLLTDDPGRLAELSVLLGMRGQNERLFASATATEALIASPKALNALVTSVRGSKNMAANPDAMNAVIASSTAMTAVAASSAAMTAVAASSTAMTAVIDSSTAMAAVTASSTAMNAVAASSTAMAAVIASSTAMAAVAASSTAMNAMNASDTAMNALYASPLVTKVNYSSIQVWSSTVTLRSGTTLFVRLITKAGVAGWGEGTTGNEWMVFDGAQVNYAERNANPYNHTASTSSPRLPMRRCASSLQIRPYQACEIAYIALTA